MATDKIVVVFLACDQGMGTLIKIYDDSNPAKLTHLALVDLGSESKSKKYATTAVTQVMNALREMDIPTINLLVVSHQDYDHWSLLPNLQKEMREEFGDDASIQEILFGGQEWGPSAKKAMRSLQNEFDVTAESFEISATDYGKPGTKKTFRDLEGVAFHVLVANVRITRSAKDLIRNGTSAVLAVEFGGVFVILPGDATADTIGWINDHVFEAWDKKGKGNPVHPCRALGAPHHGALRTIADNYVATIDADLTKATVFADYVAAQEVFASAGYYSQFLHPYQSVMELLSKHGSKTSNHNWTWYNDKDSAWEAVTDEDLPIFTTVVDFSNPPTIANWQFTIDELGKITVELGERFPLHIPRGRRRERHAAVSHKKR